MRKGIGGNIWYLTFTSYLQKNGIAVLLPDKRGCEASGGSWRTASFQDLATDTLAAVAFLRHQHEDVISAIGLLGASQGGQIAPIVASQSEEVSFVINVVGSVVPFHDALVYEENNNLREMGFLPGISRALASLSSLYIRNFAQKDLWDAIGNYDPLPYWRKVKVPALVLYGDQDSNVPTKRSTGRLRSLGKPNIRVVVFQGSGHPLEEPKGAGDSYFRPDALEQMRDFVLKSVPAR